jgi:hypothetical protein
MNNTRALMVFALGAASLAAVGCTKHQTELILVVTTEGVRIPDDVQKLHLTVTDRQASLDDTVYEQDVALCNPQLTSSCYDIPVTAALFPGKTRGSDSVRVQVDAIGPGGIVIADAALFTFAEEQSLRLDFVLYANCLGNVACAARDQACGPLDTCIDLHPGPTNGPLDLALPVSDDMSIPLDMTPVDLVGADLTQVPPDLTSTLDMAGCAGVMCDMGETCVAGVCQGCGNMGEVCCFMGAGGTSGGGTCNQTNLVCAGNICQPCGNLNQLCCMTAPTCNGVLLCGGDDYCHNPPMIDMFMKPPDMSLTVSDMGLMGSLDLF